MKGSQKTAYLYMQLILRIGLNPLRPSQMKVSQSIFLQP